MTNDRAGSPDEGRIVATPGVVGGKPRLAGTRLETELIWFIVIQNEMAVNEVCGPDYYPSITRADVLAAVAFEWGRRTSAKLPEA